MNIHVSNSSSSEASAHKPNLGIPVNNSGDTSKARSSFLTSGIVAVVVILGMAFLVVSYYRVFVRWCARRSRLRTRLRSRTHGSGIVDFDTAVNQSSTNGLEDALIQTIPVYMFKQGDGLIESTECSICLSDFQTSDQLRLLPKCDHAFHLSCIDVWLKTHSNCPLCRAPIVSQVAYLTNDQRQDVPLLELSASVPDSVNEERPSPSFATFPSYAQMCAQMEVERSSRNFEMQDPRSYSFPVRIRILSRACSLPERKYHGDKTRFHPMRRHSSTRRQPFPVLRRLNSTGSFRDGLLTIFDSRQEAKHGNELRSDALSVNLEEFRNARYTPIEGDFAVIDVSTASSSNNSGTESPKCSDMMLNNTSRSQELKACIPKAGMDQATKRISFSHELKTKGKFGDVEDFAALRKSWSYAAAYRMKRSFSGGGGRLFQILNNKRNTCEIQRHPI